MAKLHITLKEGNTLVRDYDISRCWGFKEREVQMAATKIAGKRPIERILLEIDPPKET